MTWVIPYTVPLVIRLKMYNCKYIILKVLKEGQKRKTNIQ